MSISPAQVGLLFAMAGVAFFVLAAYSARWLWKFFHGSLTATGEVVEIVKVTEMGLSPNGPYSHSLEHNLYPKIRFRTASGNEISFQSIHVVGWTDPNFVLGQRVRVRYQRDRPAQAEIDRYVASWVILAVAAAIGTVLMYVGVGRINAAI